MEAHYVRHKAALAPKIHKLQYLAEKSDVELSDELKDFFGVLMQFQIEGRYPEFYPLEPSKQESDVLLEMTKDTYQWLAQKLSLLSENIWHS